MLQRRLCLGILDGTCVGYSVSRVAIHLVSTVAVRPDLIYLPMVGAPFVSMNRCRIHLLVLSISNYAMDDQPPRCILPSLSARRIPGTRSLSAIVYINFQSSESSNTVTSPSCAQWRVNVHVISSNRAPLILPFVFMLADTSKSVGFYEVKLGSNLSLCHDYSLNLVVSKSSSCD